MQASALLHAERREIDAGFSSARAWAIQGGNIRVGVNAARSEAGRTSQRGTMEGFTEGCVPTKINPGLQQACLIPLGAANSLGLGDTTAPVRLPLAATAKRPVRKESARTAARR